METLSAEVFVFLQILSGWRSRPGTRCGEGAPALSRLILLGNFLICRLLCKRCLQPWPGLQSPRMPTGEVLPSLGDRRSRTFPFSLFTLSLPSMHVIRMETVD